MVKVKFIKNHVHPIKKGDIGEFNEGHANYLIKVGAAELLEESSKEPKKVKKETKKEDCKTC